MRFIVNAVLREFAKSGVDVVVCDALQEVIFQYSCNDLSCRFFDTAQGRPVGEPYVHPSEVSEVMLSQVGNATERQLFIIDRSRDLWLTPIMRRSCTKLAAMVDSARWHDNTGMLAAVADSTFVSCVVDSLPWGCCATARDCDVVIASHLINVSIISLIVFLHPVKEPCY